LNIIFVEVMSGLSFSHDHQYALDSSGKWINAAKTAYKAGVVYFCDCPDRHRMKLVKSSGRDDRRHFSDYFAHVTPKHKLNGKVISCRPCGESALHRIAKQKLREMQGKYTFAVEECPECHKKVLEDCSGGQIRIEVSSSNGRWRYDCMLFRDEKPAMALEILHTHATSREKIENTRASGLLLAEFRADEVNNMTEGGQLCNLQTVFRQCKICRDLEVKLLRLEELELECDILADQQSDICAAYEKQWNIQNIELLIELKPLKEKAKSIIEIFCDILIIENPRYGDVPVLPSKTLEHGFELERGDGLPTKHMYLLLVDNAEEDDCLFIQSQLLFAHGLQIERDFVLVLHASTLVCRLSQIKAAYMNSDSFYLKDCKWPILKTIEDGHNICASCGKRGHKSEKCFRKFCTLCGFLGHTQIRCFAKQNVMGEKVVKYF